jgi:drug/metabolite transporter (DMT)-like permease
VTVALGLVAALCAALGAIRTKSLVADLPARQLIGPLFALNALIAVPGVLAGDRWDLDGSALLLHAASVGCLALSTFGLFALFEHGTASASVTAIAIAPIPAALAALAIGADTLDPVRASAAIAVVLAVGLALPGAFGTLARGHAAAAVVSVAVGNGLLTVVSARLLRDGSGIFTAYLVRTALAAAIFYVLFPPRAIPYRRFPALGSRALLVSGQFFAILFAVRRGSPVVVQTMVATTPLLALVIEQATGSARASRRSLLCAVLALVAVVVMATS